MTNNSYHLYRHGLKLADDLLLVDPASFRHESVSNYRPFLVCKDWNIWNFHALHRLSGQIVSWKERKSGISGTSSETNNFRAEEKKETNLSNNVKRNELEDMGVVAMMSSEDNQGTASFDPIWTNILKRRCLFCVEYGSDEPQVVWTCSEQKQATIYPGNFSRHGQFVIVEITRSWQAPFPWIIHSVQKWNL